MKLATQARTTPALKAGGKAKVRASASPYPRTITFKSGSRKRSQRKSL